MKPTAKKETGRLIDKVSGKTAPIDREYIEGETPKDVESVNEQRHVRDKARREPKRGVDKKKAG